ncbi:hypothetical protein D3C87_1632560 [compost metagenome]
MPAPAVISRTLRSVPAAMAIIIGQSRATIALKSGPASNCQILVMKEGRMSSPAATTGGMKRPSTPMATVGSPMPVTPLTMPATVKVAKTISMVVVSKSGTGALQRSFAFWPGVPARHRKRAGAARFLLPAGEKVARRVG